MHDTQYILHTREINANRYTYSANKGQKRKGASLMQECKTNGRGRNEGKEEMRI